MANRVIVAVFATQNHAYDAARHIQNLDKDGIIQLKRGAIATKDAKGKQAAQQALDAHAVRSRSRTGWRSPG